MVRIKNEFFVELSSAEDTLTQLQLIQLMSQL